MGKRVPDDVRLLLNDVDWLTSKHINELYSISELAVILKVTVGLVRKSLRLAGIESPSSVLLRNASNTRKYGVKNVGELASVRSKANATMTSRYGGHIWSNACNQLNRNDKIQSTANAIKTSKTKLGNAYEVLTDANWLYDQHYTLSKSILTISSELNIQPSTLVSYFAKNGIEPRKTTIPYHIEQKLTDHQWLSHQHIELRKPCNQIADECGVSSNTVSKYIIATLSEVTIHSRLNDDAYDSLNDRSWLHQQVSTLMKSFNQIGDELNVSSDVVADYCNKYGISGIGLNSKLHNDVLLKLANKDWMSHQHIELKKPLIQIATELGFCDNTPTNSGIMTKFMRKHGITVHRHTRSYGESQVLEFIKTIVQCEVINNDRNVIHPYELDIYIPSLNIAIEYCGLYWHSNKFKSNNYHRDKMVMCNKVGIRLITLFEDEWMMSPRIVKSKLKSILNVDDSERVYARKTSIRSITTSDKKAFFDDYHIQGNGPGSITYGLSYDGVICAMITFKCRDKLNGVYELNRYATNCIVVGGFSKLLEHFKRSHDWSSIISFADLRWSVGELYHTTGWTLEKTSLPDYAYIVNDVRIHKFNFRHNKLKKRLKNYDPSLSESVNCANNNVHKIYNCGLCKFVVASA